jgi:hypothetical protein
MNQDRLLYRIAERIDYGKKLVRHAQQHLMIDTFINLNSNFDAMLVLNQSLIDLQKEWELVRVMTFDELQRYDYAK